MRRGRYERNAALDLGRATGEAGGRYRTGAVVAGASTTGIVGEAEICDRDGHTLEVGLGRVENIRDVRWAVVSAAGSARLEDGSGYFRDEVVVWGEYLGGVGASWEGWQWALGIDVGREIRDRGVVGGVQSFDRSGHELTLLGFSEVDTGVAVYGCGTLSLQLC